LSIFSDRIFHSSVDLGMPNLAAASLGPNTRPRVSFRAASIKLFSCARSFRGSSISFLALSGAAGVTASVRRWRRSPFRKGSPTRCSLVLRSGFCLRRAFREVGLRGATSGLLLDDGLSGNNAINGFACRGDIKRRNISEGTSPLIPHPRSCSSLHRHHGKS